MKFVILDSGPIISMTLNGLLYTLELLKNKFPDIVFIITPHVKKEVIDKPMTIRQYKLESIKVQNLLDAKIISLSSEFVSNNALEKETNRLMNLANSILKADGNKVNIIHLGEASCLAFSKLCKVENVIAIDERITRIITESPENLKQIMERKIHMPVLINDKIAKEFKNFKFIRSPEIVYLAYKNDLYKYKKNKNVLDALLYSLKYAGATISSKEIEKIKNL